MPRLRLFLIYRKAARTRNPNETPRAPLESTSQNAEFECNARAAALMRIAIVEKLFSEFKE
jgi:hypothetical protein